MQVLLSDLSDESAALMHEESSEPKNEQNRRLSNNHKIEQDELISSLRTQLKEGRARFAEETKKLMDDHANKLKQKDEELVNMTKTFGCFAKVWQSD